MANIGDIEYKTIYGETVAFEDGSVRAKERGYRGNGKQQTRFDWEPQPELGIMALNLELELRFRSDRILKLLVRFQFKVSAYARVKGMEDRMGLPETMYLAMAYEAWDFAMSHLRSQPTPIATLKIPRPPDAAILGGAQLPPVSLN